MTELDILELRLWSLEITIQEIKNKIAVLKHPTPEKKETIYNGGRCIKCDRRNWDNKGDIKLYYYETGEGVVASCCSSKKTRW